MRVIYLSLGGVGGGAYYVADKKGEGCVTVVVVEIYGDVDVEDVAAFELAAGWGMD